MCMFSFCHIPEERHRPLFHSDHVCIRWDHSLTGLWISIHSVVLDSMNFPSMKSLVVGCGGQNIGQWVIFVSMCLKTCVPYYMQAFIIYCYHTAVNDEGALSLDPVSTARPSPLLSAPFCSHFTPKWPKFFLKAVIEKKNYTALLMFWIVSIYLIKTWKTATHKCSEETVNNSLHGNSMNPVQTVPLSHVPPSHQATKQVHLSSL